MEQEKIWRCTSSIDCQCWPIFLSPKSRKGSVAKEVTRTTALTRVKRNNTLNSAFFYKLLPDSKHGENAEFEVLQKTYRIHKHDSKLHFYKTIELLNFSIRNISDCFDILALLNQNYKTMLHKY